MKIPYKSLHVPIYHMGHIPCDPHIQNMNIWDLFMLI